MLLSFRSRIQHLRVPDHSLAFLAYARLAHSLPTPPRLVTLDSSDDNAQARDWVSQFERAEISKGLVEVSYSRSSGPGGQNVNKVNTKATVRCSVNSTWIPEWARPTIKKTPHYVSSSQSIMLTSTVFRSQSQNLEDCLKKLHSVILNAANATIVTETSDETKERIANHERVAKERRKADKVYRSEIKKTRRKPGSWD